MIGIIIIIFIGRQFYKLAEQYNQNKWVFGILGILSYYVGAFLGGIILAVLDDFLGFGLDWNNNIVLTLIALPFSIGAVYIFYYLLKKSWKNTVVLDKNSEIQDIGKDIEE